MEVDFVQYLKDHFLLQLKQLNLILVILRELNLHPKLNKGVEIVVVIAVVVVIVGEIEDHHYFVNN